MHFYPSATTYLPSLFPFPFFAGIPSVDGWSYEYNIQSVPQTVRARRNSAPSLTFRRRVNGCHSRSTNLSGADVHIYTCNTPPSYVHITAWESGIAPGSDGNRRGRNMNGNVIHVAPATCMRKRAIQLLMIMSNLRKKKKEQRDWSLSF